MRHYIFMRGKKRGAAVIKRAASRNTIIMLVVFIKSVVIFFVVFVAIRLMGKRQIGEMQPMELVITLVVAEIACIPINDPYIPFYSGIVPIITLTFLHITLSFIARKSIKLRQILSGRSMIVIDKEGVNYENLKKLNINMNDLIEAIRTSGYMDINEIEYAIIETNGNMCVVEKTKDPTAIVPALLPLPLIIDGAWNKENLSRAGLTSAAVSKELKNNNIKKEKDVLYADVRQDGTLYVSPKKGKYFTAKVKIKGGGW